MKMIKKYLPLLIFFTIFFTVEPVYAQSATTMDSQRLLANLQQIIGVILSMLSILIWPLLTMIGALMSNDLIFGPQVEDRLFLIWGQVRNFINLAFVLVLVGLALYNVAGIGEESNYTLKKILPKFIIALIVVNFTFFGARVVLSSVNVLTTAIFALPNSVEGTLTTIDTNAIATRMCPTVAEVYPENSFCLDQNTFTPQAESYFRAYSGDNIAFIMAINYAQIGEILRVSELVRQVPTLTNVTVNLLISLLMYFIYTIAFVVMFIVLVVRVVVLWFLIAFSPIIALQIVFPEGLKSITGDFDIQSLFIKHAFAPAIIGMGLVIGHMLLDAYSQNTTPSLGSSLALGADFGNAFSAGSDGIQQILIGIAAAAVIWKVSFSAAEGTLAKGITDSIKSGVSNTATRVAKLPTFIPIVPVPESLGDGTGKASYASIMGTPGEMFRQFEESNRQPLVPITHDTVQSHARSRDSRRPEYDKFVIRTLPHEQQVQQALTIGNMREMITSMRDRREIDSAQAEEILRALPTDSNVQGEAFSTLSPETQSRIIGHITNGGIEGGTGRFAQVLPASRTNRQSAASQVVASPAAQLTQQLTTLAGVQQLSPAQRQNLETRLSEAQSLLADPTNPPTGEDRSRLEAAINSARQKLDETPGPAPAEPTQPIAQPEPAAELAQPEQAQGAQPASTQRPAGDTPPTQEPPTQESR